MATKPTGSNFDGPTVVPDPDLELGMNFDLWSRDRAGFRTSERMVTGGVSMEFGAMAGPEVGWNYQDGLGEDRNEPTYPSSNTMHHISNPPGRMAAEGAVSPGSDGKKTSTGFGKSFLQAPQNYRIKY